ncbi:hypothetical protein WN55_03755 [Dufourea novaeangliae]|uniref:Uncharacterized protein n=1 Tax=Dufourea novaeangliae TaxID=178035 RepID=A0A154PK35_DUFNO|nr:hypothetical protein WN55_03755 [Dufourea novaeangliae]
MEDSKMAGNAATRKKMRSAIVSGLLSKGLSMDVIVSFPAIDRWDEDREIIERCGHTKNDRSSD